MKFLCVCDGGNVRSVGMAFALKHREDLSCTGDEAIAIGRGNTSMDTLAMLCEWADRIIIMQPHMKESIGLKYIHKIVCVDVGPDRYGVYVHPELLQQVRAGVQAIQGAKECTSRSS